MSKIKIGITQGDVNGIGYEVILKAFAHEEMFELCTPIVYGNEKVAHYQAKQLEEVPSVQVIASAEEAHAHRINLIQASEEECTVEFGKVSPTAGRQAQAALTRAMADWKAGLIDVIVTAPICKAALQSDSFPYADHTEYFEAATEAKALQIFSTPYARVALATTKLPISQLAEAITPELLEERVQMLHRSLMRDYLCVAPRIAVLGLNPQCGEEGEQGTEEAEIIAPTIKRLREEQHVPCFGPYSAEQFFGEGMYAQFDAVLAMYHDQGVAPLKAMSSEAGAVFTTGLPFVHTTTDHDACFDIAGQGKATPDSMRQAIFAAIDIFRNRQAYDEAHENPLPFNPRRSERPIRV